MARPRVGRMSLMMLHRDAVRGVVGPWDRMVGPRVVITVVVVVVVAGRARVVVLLRCLPLGVFLVFHSAVLEPYFDLPLREVEVSRQLPPLLLGDVGVEKELFLQLERLELGVGLALFSDSDLAGPLQGVLPGPARHP